MAVVALSFATLILVVVALGLAARLRGARLETNRLRGLIARRADEMTALRQADGAVLQHVPDPLIVLDAARAVRRTNAAARIAFGADIGAALRHPELRGAIDRALGTGSGQEADLSLPVPVVREVHATLVPLDPPLADGGSLLVVLSDRSRERAIERMRADFVANVSHELRTPLASLLGFIETLRGPAADDPPAQQRFLAIMAEQAGRMNRLIDDLLSLARIELTEHQPPAGQVDLRALAAQTAASFEPRLAGGAARLDLDLADDLAPVPGDADQLAQVLHNLLDNALKYGRPDGTVRLVLGVAPRGDRWPARNGVLLAVADEGGGIPRAHVPRLTERFYRVDAGRSRAGGGTGLGLAIVKHIVNRHRGQLAIDSTEGVGTTVSIWLPAPQLAVAAPETGRSSGG